MASARKFIDDNLTEARANDPKWLMNRMDLCHLGFWLRIGSYYLGKDARLAATATFVTETALARRRLQLPHPHQGRASQLVPHDIQCSRRAHRGCARREHRREGLPRSRRRRRSTSCSTHKLYRSDKTGEIIDERFTHLTYPSHWHYTVLRGLDYIRETPEIGDKRLDDPIAMIEGRRKPNGRWVTEKRIPGVEHFDDGEVGRREPLGDTQGAAGVEGASTRRRGRTEPRRR